MFWGHIWVLRRPFGAPEIIFGGTSGSHQIDRGACHDCSQGRLYYSRVRLSYLGLSGLFGGCSGAVGVCRGMFGAPTGLFGGLLSSSGNS